MACDVEAGGDILVEFLGQDRGHNVACGKWSGSGNHKRKMHKL
jgi:hypothetical protein